MSYSGERPQMVLRRTSTDKSSWPGPQTSTSDQDLEENFARSSKKALLEALTMPLYKNLLRASHKKFHTSSPNSILGIFKIFMQGPRRPPKDLLTMTSTRSWSSSWTSKSAPWDHEALARSSSDRLETSKTSMPRPLKIMGNVKMSTVPQERYQNEHHATKRAI